MSEYQPFNDKWGVQWVATISCPQQQQSKQNHYSDMFRTALAHCYSKEISQNTNRTAVGNSQALVWEQSASSQDLRNVSLSAAFPRVWNLESRNAIALHCGWPCSHIHLALALTMGVGVATWLAKGLVPSSLLTFYTARCLRELHRPIHNKATTVWTAGSVPNAPEDHAEFAKFNQTQHHQGFFWTISMRKHQEGAACMFEDKIVVHMVSTVHYQILSLVHYQILKIHF